MSTVLTSVRDTINALTGGDLPINIDRERGINLLYKLFIPFLDDYLSEEQLCVKTKSQELIDEWVSYYTVTHDDLIFAHEYVLHAESEFGCATRRRSHFTIIQSIS